MYRILGLRPETDTPSVESFFGAVHPEDRERAQSAASQSLEDGVLPLVDCRVVRPDGAVRHTTSSSSTIFDAEGAVRRIVGGVLDRTVTLEVEAKLLPRSRCSKRPNASRSSAVIAATTLDDAIRVPQRGFT